MQGNHGTLRGASNRCKEVDTHLQGMDEAH